MKKYLKMAIICILAVIIIFISYIGIEIYRFNTKLGCQPLFQIRAQEINISSENNKKKDLYDGLFISFEYEYILERNESSDVQSKRIYKGEMRLFNKISVKKWEANHLNF